jgi:hypothetical protein
LFVLYCFVLFLNRQQRKFTAKHNNAISRNNASLVSVRNNQHQALSVVGCREPKLALIVVGCRETKQGLTVVVCRENKQAITVVGFH